MEIFHAAEVAALVSIHSPLLIERTDPLPDEPLHAYWENSRRRLALWRKTFETPSAVGKPDPRQTLVEEIFVAEILTRIWTGVLTACDRHRRTRHAEPLARSIFLDHLECRCRAMQFLVHEPTISNSELARIDRFRRRTERWTDALLAHVIRQHDVSEFAFDSSRAREFANDRSSRDLVMGRSHLAKFLLAGLQFAFANMPSKQPLDAVSHTGILKSILTCFPSDAFDQNGSLRSVQNTRIARSGRHSEQTPTVTWPLPATAEAGTPLNNIVPRSVRFSHLRRPRTDS